MSKCAKCVFYNLKPSSLTYNLSYCLKFNTFSEIARLDEEKCGPTFKKFQEINYKQSKKIQYNKYSTNF